MNIMDDLKSIESKEPSYLRIFNKASKDVDIIWINYTGQKHYYKTLKARQFVDINTFVTHPWVFEDCEKRNPLLANRKKILMPAPSHEDANGKRRRYSINITIPVYSLRDRCFQVIYDQISQPRRHQILFGAENREEVFDDLGLPTTLSDELFEHIKVTHERQHHRHSLFINNNNY